MIGYIIDLFLFFYISWAFVRLGHLQRLYNGIVKTCDSEWSEIWEAFTKHIKGETNADSARE